MLRLPGTYLARRGQGLRRLKRWPTLRRQARNLFNFGHHRHPPNAERLIEETSPWLINNGAAGPAPNIFLIYNQPP